MALTRHCHQCGWEYTPTRQPGRSESCERCQAELHVCLNCSYYEARRTHQCREPRAEPVADKDRANYCEWFELARRAYGPATSGSAAADPRDQLKKLLGL